MYFVMLVSRLLFLIGIEKSTFAEVGSLMIPGLIFPDLGWPLGPIFANFVALETCLKFDDFS